MAWAAGLIACACQGGNPGAAHTAPNPRQFQGKTVVSLTFDDQYAGQWLYGAPLIAAHKMTATYYVITSDSKVPYHCCMSWSQLHTLQSEGNDIGSHSLSHPNLTKLSGGQLTREICGSRQDMVSHGIADPLSFAYPFGAYNSTVESAVRQCGYKNARAAGGISTSVATPSAPYQETIPPKDTYAIRAIAVDGSRPVQLANLESFVTAAATHGGGWLPIDFHEVCDARSAGFSHCMSTYGAVQDTVLGQFLDWLAAAGRPGGAPAGVIVRNVCQVMTGTCAR